MKTTPLAVTPLNHFHEPRYPTQAAVLEDPRVLRIVPRRWSAKPVLCGMLMLTVAGGLCACAGRKVPFYEYGNGAGAYGCDAVTSPTYLSEAEARRLIREEAEAYGVYFTGEKTITGEFPGNWASGYDPDVYEDLHMKVPDPPTWKGELELHGYDENIGIGFEYVSVGDVSAWRMEGGITSTVEIFNMKDTAKRLSEAVRDVAVFYDPVYYKGTPDSDPESLRENLRLQVRDFLEWLKAEGII